MKETNNQPNKYGNAIQVINFTIGVFLTLVN